MLHNDQQGNARLSETTSLKSLYNIVRHVDHISDSMLTLNFENGFGIFTSRVSPDYKTRGASAAEQANVL